MNPFRHMNRCFWFMTGLLFLALAAADGKAAAPEMRISIDAQNESLGHVLAVVGRQATCTIRFDHRWEGHLVKASFQNLPLGEGLKRILANLNHAIIYESVHDIKILIYGEMASRPAGPSTFRPYAPPIPTYREEPIAEPEQAPPVYERPGNGDTDIASPSDRGESEDSPSSRE